MFMKDDTCIINYISCTIKREKQRKVSSLKYNKMMGWREIDVV